MTDAEMIARKEAEPPSLRIEIEQAINRCSAENGSNTPDFILAEYLTDCLAAWDKAVAAREKWWGRADPWARDLVPQEVAPPTTER